MFHSVMSSSWCPSWTCSAVSKVVCLEILLSAVGNVRMNILLFEQPSHSTQSTSLILLITFACIGIFLSSRKSDLFSVSHHTEQPLCHHLRNTGHYFFLFWPKLTVELSFCLKQGHQIPPWVPSIYVSSSNGFIGLVLRMSHTVWTVEAMVFGHFYLISESVNRIWHKCYRTEHVKRFKSFFLCFIYHYNYRVFNLY